VQQNTLYLLYRRTKDKFDKLNSRYRRKLSKGTFSNLQDRDRYKTLSRLRRLYRKLCQLRHQLKLAAAAGSIILSTAFLEAEAQTSALGPFMERGADSPVKSPIIQSRDYIPSFGDLDNDGDLDMVVGRTNGTIGFYYNTGTSSAPQFREVVNPILDDVGSNAAPELADIDNDGDLDLFVGSFSNIAFFRNDGTVSSPSFTRITGAGNPASGISIPFGPSKPAFVDIDGDGDLDCFNAGSSSGYTETIGYFENIGDDQNPSFQQRYGATNLLFSFNEYNQGNLGGWPSGAYYDKVALSFADLDGDNDYDLIVGHDEDVITYFRNDGTASAPNLVFSGGPGDFEEVTGQVFYPELVDIDGDGDLDLIAGSNDQVYSYGSATYYNSGIRYYENNGSFALDLQEGFDNPFGGLDVGFFAAPFLADIDGDTDQELISGSRNSIQLFQNAGNQFSRDTIPSLVGIDRFTVPYSNFKPAFVDIDGDQDLDLFAFEFDSLRYFENTGNVTNPVFAERTGAANPLNLLNSISFYEFSPTFGDVDEDGDYDVMVSVYYGSGTGQLLYVENIGDATSPNFNIVSGPSIVDPVNFLFIANGPSFLSDVDNDGDLDLLIRREYLGTQPTFLFQNNNGFLSQAAGFNNPFHYLLDSTSAPRTFHYADFDEDGDKDMLKGTDDGHIVFYENMNAVPTVSTISTGPFYAPLDAPVALMQPGDLSISDDDTVFIQATVQITNFSSSEDRLSFTPSANVNGSFDQATGILTLSGSAGPLEYTQVLESVTYENLVADPDPADRTVRIALTDQDATNNTTFAELFVEIPDPPVIANVSDLIYTEGDNPTAFAAQLTVTDNDSPDLTGAVISFISGYVNGEDILQTSAFPGGITGSFDVQSGVLTLSGLASVLDYQTAIQQVLFFNNSQTPTAGIRSLRVDISDEYYTTSTQINIEVVPVNDPPVIVISQSPDSEFRIGDQPVFVDNALTIFDNDDSELSGATVTILAYENGNEELIFTDQNGIVGSWNAGTGVLQLTGTATLSEYEDALRSILFDRFIPDQSATTRTIQFNVSDGTDNSVPVLRDISILAAPSNDPPIIQSTTIEVVFGSTAVFELSPIISDIDGNLDLSTLLLLSQPPSGATASIQNGSLLVDYSGIQFVGVENVDIEVCDTFGECTSEAINIEVLPTSIYVFNAVTPNSDGKHDFLEIANIEAYPDNIVKVYNRYGEEVYSGLGYNNTSIRFEGNSSGGSLLPAGTYFYVINPGEGEETVSGDFLLKY